MTNTIATSYRGISEVQRIEVEDPDLAAGHMNLTEMKIAVHGGQRRIQSCFQVTRAIDNQTNLAADVRECLGKRLVPAVTPDGQMIVNPERDAWHGSRSMELRQPGCIEAHVLQAGKLPFDECLEWLARHLLHEKESQMADVAIGLGNMNADGWS